MMSQPPRDNGEREPRVPLYVRVITQPAIHDIWAINISPTGIGLVAAAWKGGPEPREGDAIDLEFPLPGISDEIRARGEVTWRYDTPTPDDDSVSLSVIAHLCLSRARWNA